MIQGNLLTKQTQTQNFHSQKKKKKIHRQIYGCQRENNGGSIKWEIWINIHSLLCMEWMSNKDLLYSTGKSTQYSAVTYMGEEFEKEWIYVYV